MIQTLLLHINVTCTFIIILAYVSTSNFLGTPQLLHSIVMQLFFFQIRLLSAPNIALSKFPMWTSTLWLVAVFFFTASYFPFLRKQFHLEEQKLQDHKCLSNSNKLRLTHLLNSTNGAKKWMSWIVSSSENLQEQSRMGL